MKKISLTEEMDILMKNLFPLNRGLVSKNNLISLQKIKKIIKNLKILSVKSGTKVFDWKIPKEWIIKDGYIKSFKNKKILDFKKNNLHVATNSIPVNKIIKIKYLKRKIFYSENSKSSIPYRTIYYKKDWGFCATKKQYQDITKHKKLKVKIESKFKNGNLNIGELVIKGKSKKEFLISTYICHPSLANDNLSGIILTTFLSRYLSKKKNYWTYRIVFLPETIGAITYLKLREREINKNVIGGFNISCVGGKENFSFKESFNSKHFLNYLVEKYFKRKKMKIKKYNFDINGSDERQYSSKGFGINIVSIFKGKYYDYKQYHTSADNLKYVNASNILKTYLVYKDLINLLEKQRLFKSTKTKGELMLNKYNLDRDTGGSFLPNRTKKSVSEIVLWINYLMDGTLNLEQISEKMSLDKKYLENLILLLLKKKILKKL